MTWTENILKLDISLTEIYLKSVESHPFLREWHPFGEDSLTSRLSVASWMEKHLVQMQAESYLPLTLQMDFIDKELPF